MKNIGVVLSGCGVCRIVSTPAYMLSPTISIVARGIKNL